MKKPIWMILIVALAVIALDQLSKFLVSMYLPLGGAWSPLPGPHPLFQIVHTYNTGVAFGMFKNLGPVFVVIALVISGVIIAYARKLRSDQWLTCLALGLMLGGAVGNVIDRLRLGHVIDFFDVGVGTLRNASNMADWAIVSGVILLGLATLLDERKQKKAHASEAGHSGS